MSAIVRYANENHDQLLSEFCGCGLDLPESASLFKTGDKIQFSGWVVPPKETKLSITVKKSSALYKKYTCDINRPDVILAKNIPNTDITCGFSFEIECNSSYEVFFCYAQKELLIWEVIFFDDDFELDPTLNAIKEDWLSIHTHLNMVPPTYSTEKLNDFFLRIPTFNKASQIKTRAEQVSLIKNLDIDNFKKSIEILSNPNWNLDAISHSIKTENLSIKSPLTNGKATCCHSISIDDFNFLIFHDENSFFYLVQHCTTICIVIPKLLCVFSLSDPNWVQEAKKRLAKLYISLTKKKFYLNTEPARFLGILIAQSRPYHYFYDYLYGVQLLESRGIPLNELSFFSIDGYNFYNVEELFGQEASEPSRTESELNNLIQDRNGFLLTPCVQYCTTHNNEAIQALDKKLIKTSTQKHIKSENKEPITQDFYKYFPIIWIGISSEKRAWLEQVEGFSKIIKALKSTFPNLCVIVDGRTFTLTPTTTDHTHKAKESLLFEQLKTLNPDIAFINAIGRFASEKIYLANRCDFFITAYSTDSMYPSRVCGKPGVVYAPSCMGEGPRSLHIHHNIIEVPKERISDISPDPGKAAWHTVSCSIDWHDIFKSILNLINTYPLRKI